MQIRGKRWQMKMLIGTALAAMMLCNGTTQGRTAETLPIDLTKAVVIASSQLTGPENKAVQMLIEEVERRTQIRWERIASVPNGSVAVISIGHQSLKAPRPAEGYQILTEGSRVS